MKKVSILSLHLGYGGIEKAIVTLANSLCNNYDVEIISIYKLNEESAFPINQKVSVKYLIESDIAERVKSYKELLFQGKVKQLLKEVWKDYLKKFKILSLIYDTFYGLKVMLYDRKHKMVREIKNCDADFIISTRDLFNGWLGKYGSKKAKKVAWEHNHHHGNVEYAANVVDSCKEIDELILVSDSLRSFYKKKMKEKGYKCKCNYIPNTIDEIPKVVSPLKDSRIISVGRFSREKGMPDLIDVFHLVHEQNPKLKLELVGDGPQKNMIIDKIYEYGLEKSVTVHGYLSQKKIGELLKKSSLYVMTSFTESFGLVLIEAMSYGIPCIAFSTAEGACDLIENKKNGYLIDERNQEKMATTIIKLMNDEEERKRLGQNAREKSMNYTTENVKEMWTKILK